MCIFYVRTFEMKEGLDLNKSIGIKIRKDMLRTLGHIDKTAVKILLCKMSTNKLISQSKLVPTKNIYG